MPREAGARRIPSQNLAEFKCGSLDRWRGREATKDKLQQRLDFSVAPSWMFATSVHKVPFEDFDGTRLLVRRGPVGAELAEIETVSLHSSCTAKSCHTICN
jgi:hypothetical protein